MTSHTDIVLNLDHLAPSVQPIAMLGSTDRIHRAGGNWIVRHPAIEEVMNHVRWLVEGPTRVRTKGILVTGEVGSGKTTLSELIYRRYRDDDHRAEPVVKIVMTGARHMRAIYGRIIDALHAPVKSTHHTSDREATASRLLRTVGCRALVVDEIQDVLAHNKAEQRNTIDALKYIMNTLHIPVFAFGTSPAVKSFDTDDHMKSRFDRYELPEWSRGPELVALLSAVGRVLPLRRPSALTRGDVIEKLVGLSGGNMDEMMQVIRLAAVAAIVSGTESIGLNEIEEGTRVPDMKAIDGVAHVD